MVKPDCNMRRIGVAIFGETNAKTTKELNTPTVHDPHHWSEFSNWSRERQRQVMGMDAFDLSSASPKNGRKLPISVSRWVNEKLPPRNQILTARDVARLTRRHHWILRTLALVGQFPRPLRYHGRGIGWQRSEVLEWLSRDPALTVGREFCPSATRRCARRPRQGCLPLECLVPCSASRGTVRNTEGSR
jgi:predicted DNA-binding transcriptional regulator AlpA